MKAVLSRQAQADLLLAARWIRRDNPAAARAFRRTIDAALRRIGDHPEIGVERKDIAAPPARFLAMSDFPYVLVYDSHPPPPMILRILHGARDLPETLRDL